MTREQARAAFSAALEGELDPAQAREFEGLLERDAELAREYESFAKLVAAVRAQEPGERTPDLLPGVQQRLRTRSRGRFYTDRFAARLGRGLPQPLPLALLLLTLVVLAWLALGALRSIALE